MLPNYSTAFVAMEWEVPFILPAATSRESSCVRMGHKSSSELMMIPCGFYTPFNDYQAKIIICKQKLLSILIAYFRGNSLVFDTKIEDMKWWQ
jgi:hypothetical protein